MNRPLRLDPWAESIDLWMVFLGSCPLSIYVKTSPRRFLPAPGENAVVPRKAAQLVFEITCNNIFLYTLLMLMQWEWHVLGIHFSAASRGLFRFRVAVRRRTLLAQACASVKQLLCKHVAVQSLF